MDKLRISQIQFSASHIPNLNAKILEQNFKKTLKFKPHLICTPECSNIITNDKNFLILNASYQNTCPVLKMAKDFAKKNKVNINLGSLLLKVKKQRKLVNRSFFIDNNGVIKKTYDKINKIGFRPNKVSICKKEKGLLTGEVKFIEYLGSEQFIYVDCGIDEKLVVVKTNPDYKISLRKIVGLKMLSKDLYFFLKKHHT